MHNLKEIRKDFDAFEKSLEKRSIDVDFKKLKDLDIQNRDLIQKKETLIISQTQTETRYFIMCGTSHMD